MRVHVLNVKENKNDDDDDDDNRDENWYKFNNINTNSRFIYGATAADAAAAIVVIFPLVVAVLRAFMCVRTRQSIDDGATQNWNRRNLVSFQSF